MKPTLFFCLFLILSCQSNEQKTNYKSSSWLLGKWQIEDDFIAFEEWKIKNDSSMTGQSIFIQSNDTSILETIFLGFKNCQVVYEPTVKNQNKGQAITFKCIYLNKDSMRFENKQHDFPQIIRYERRGTDSLTAVIEGFSDSAWKTVEFKMHKVKQ